jgi:hypothetical protein
MFLKGMRLPTDKASVRPAAIYDLRGAGGEGGIIRCQIGDERCDFFRRAQSTHCLPRDKRGMHLVTILSRFDCLIVDTLM